MSSRPTYWIISAPREGVNDDVVRIVEWLVPAGRRVDVGDRIVTLETTKATFDVVAVDAGYVHHLVETGHEIAVGSPLAVVSQHPDRPELEGEIDPREVRAKRPGRATGPLVTKRARGLLEAHGLDSTPFASLSVVRSEDVEAFLRRREDGRPAVAASRGPCNGVADPNVDHEPDEGFESLRSLLRSQRRRLKASFDRHVPLGTLLHDRWELAREYGFGEGTSVYDECLILGNVTVGRHCWIGPYTILDGGRCPLQIGDYVDVGSGTHIYTHNSIERALTGHVAPLFASPTMIGNCCFIAPYVVIAPGTVIGDHCFVAAGSYVEGSFPDYSYIAGNPARRAGQVEIRGGKVRIRTDRHPPGAEHRPSHDGLA